MDNRLDNQLSSSCRGANIVDIAIVDNLSRHHQKGKKNPF
jgi:hypothetical protein